MAHEGMNPKSVHGAIKWVGLGLIGALVAVLVGALFPSLIPSRAASVRL